VKQVILVERSVLRERIHDGERGARSLLTYLEEKACLALTPQQQRAEMESCAPLIRKLVDQKKLLAGAPVHPTSTATTIRYREGKRLLTDGHEGVPSVPQKD
jgi:hypothetical protein